MTWIGTRRLKARRNLSIEDRPSAVGDLTINPWISTNDRTLWKLQLRDLGLDFLMLECNPLNHQDLIVVTVAVGVGSQSYITLHGIVGQIDNGFMETILR